jgi:hypothetical protein
VDWFMAVSSTTAGVDVPRNGLLSTIRGQLIGTDASFLLFRLVGR